MILAWVLGADYGGGICVLFGVVTLSIAISWLVQGKRDLRAMTEHLARAASMASTPAEMDAGLLFTCSGTVTQASPEAP
jgi:Flp pilus assembly protein TadG